MDVTYTRTTHLICKLFVIDTKHVLPKRLVLTYWGVRFGIFLQIFPHLISFDWIATRGCSKHEKVLLSSSLFETHLKKCNHRYWLVPVSWCLANRKGGKQKNQDEASQSCSARRVKAQHRGLFWAFSSHGNGKCSAILGWSSECFKTRSFFRTLCMGWTI